MTATKATDFNAAKLKMQTMATMQVAHNAQVHAEWRTQGYAYYRAIWVECAEMLDHFGWKWWKQQTPDLDQVKLELVDIWHFALSELLRAERLDDTVVEALWGLESSGDCADPEAFRVALEALAADTLANRSFNVELFVTTMAALPMSYDELFTLYIGKNVLNHFRQDHGYKDGTYRKTWSGREDNEHLIELMGAIDVAPDKFADALQAALTERYADTE